MYIPAEAPAPAKATKGTKAAAAPKAKAKAKAKPEMDTLADKMQFLTMKNDEKCGFHWKKRLVELWFHENLLGRFHWKTVDVNGMHNLSNMTHSSA